jgi:hypothetical protein
VFFGANLAVGLNAALAAAGLEFAYRLVAAGFYGSLTQQFSRRSTRWSTIAALVVVPGLTHAAEYAVHRGAGTARVGLAVLASVGLSVLTTRVSLFAMRRGLLVSGHGSQPLSADLRQLLLLAVGLTIGRFRQGVHARRLTLPQ